MYKAFDNSGLTALTDHMKSTKRAADVNSSAVAELEGDFQELVQKIEEVTVEVDDCLTELETVKANWAAFGLCDATVE